MTDYEIAAAIKEAGRSVRDGLQNQRPRLVVVPLVIGSSDLTDEQAHNLAVMLKRAFEEALK